MVNKALIPLYLNVDLLNNLYTVVVQEFVEIKRVSNKDIIALHLKAPISELSYDIFGKYFQGDFEFTLQNEFVKERTEERISINIVILKKLKDLLREQNLLKDIIKEEDLYLLKESDFVEFDCILKPNPIIQHVHNIIDDFDSEAIYGENYNVHDASDANKKRENALALLKSGIDKCRTESCLRYVAQCPCSQYARLVVPLMNKCMLENEGYMLNGKVKVMGKVINVYEAQSDISEEHTNLEKEQLATKNYYRGRALLSHTNLDNIDYDELDNFIVNRNRGVLSSYKLDNNLIKVNDKLIEILPIVVYL